MASFTKFRKNWLPLTVALAVILVGVGALILVEAHRTTTVTSKKSAYDTPLHNNNSPNKTNPNDTPTQAEENSNNTNSTNPDIAGVINFSSVVGSNLTIRTTLNQNLNNGTCTLTLNRASDGKSIIKTANIVGNPSSATCAGFDIPTEELGSGNWTITIQIASGSKSGEITGNVSI